MRKTFLLLICLVSSLFLFAQEKMYIHKSDKITLGALITATDSIYFSEDGTQTYFRINGSLNEYPTAAIDSLTFGANSNTIFITYSGSSVSVINPLAFEGVSVAVNGADVTVTSTTETQDINYSLAGTTTNGMFKMYSVKRFNLLLNGVNITNPDGPAINIQSDKKTSVILVSGTTNTLTDGTTYAAAVVNGSGVSEDQKATFFSEAKLVFSGSGSLTIAGNGTDKHALCSDDLIQITDGNITVTKALKDGIHGKDGIEISGGTINVTATGDAIDGDIAYINISGGNITTTNSIADTKGISCDSILIISGGTLNITVTGNASKAIKSGKTMTLSGGTITVHTSGDAVLTASGSGYDPSYCTAIKSDATIYFSGANVTITASGKAAKGISSDTDIEISGGTLNITNSGIGTKYTNSLGASDAYVATCLTADANIRILGGSVITSSSGAAGKGISADGTLTIGSAITSPTLYITTTGTKVTISGSGTSAVTAEAKAISCNGAITIENGNITIASADDGIKSETSVTIANATVSITSSIEGIEGPFITVNSGTVSIKSSDDSFNATKGNGGEANDGSLLKINGGNITVNASAGDGLDSNGSMAINGGTIVVHGPQSSPEVGMDYNGTCVVSGGLLLISGTNSNMTQAPSTSSTQRSVLVKTATSLSASTLFHIQDASGNNIITFQPVRSYFSVVVSSSSLANGATYSVYTGGTCTGTNNNGLYTGGTYSGGTLKNKFTISSMVTTVSF
jgi:trimeric autotransporter adhesin